MSKNNLIRKSDKKHIRLEKARIRRDFLDPQKQRELINVLYAKILGQKANQDTAKAVPSEKKEAVVQKASAKPKTKASAKAKLKKVKA